MLEETQGWKLLQASWPHISQQVSNCPPTLSSTGTNITCICSFCKGCLQDKCEQLERQLQHTQRPFSRSFQKRLLKVPTPSPQFSSQDGHAAFSEDISLGEQVLTLGTNLTVFRSFAPGSWCRLVLCPPSSPSSCFARVGLWLDGAAVCQSFPLRPMWQQSRQASQPQSLPLPHLIFKEGCDTSHGGSPQLFLWPLCLSLSSWTWPPHRVRHHLWHLAQYLNVQTQHTPFHTYASFVQPYLIQTRWFMHLLSLEILIPAHTYRMRREAAIALKLACNRC